jgi:hypothetical protein
MSLQTATDLAILVNYGGAGGSKLQYGRLGSIVSKALGLDSLGVITLVLMVPPLEEVISEWLWVMRANVAEALEQLGWVEKQAIYFIQMDQLEIKNIFQIDFVLKVL